MGKYYDQCAEEWNKFIYSSVNGTFLFDRKYMKNGEHKFIDFSSVIYDNKDNLVCVFPANTIDNDVWSHQGLTYGGLIYKNNLKTPEFMKIFDLVISKLKLWNVKKLIYKPVPYIYRNEPCESDLYALYKFNAKLINRDISTVINLKNNTFIDYSERKQRNILKAKKYNFEIKSTNISWTMWLMLEKSLLERHDTKPTHTWEQIIYLSDNFPNNIATHSILIDKELYSAIIMYYTGNVGHIQYVISSEKARENHAIDFLIDWLIQKYKTSALLGYCKYFDFGISNERNPNKLNEGLITFKEEFGGTSICYDTYQIDM